MTAISALSAWTRSREIRSLFLSLGCAVRRCRRVALSRSFGPRHTRRHHSLGGKALHVPQETGIHSPLQESAPRFVMLPIIDSFFKIRLVFRNPSFAGEHR